MGRAVTRALGHREVCMQPLGQKTDYGQEKIPAVTWARYSPETLYLCLCRVIHISSIMLPGDVAREVSLQVYLLF